MKITDEQVTAAVDAAEDEFKMWRLTPLGGAGSRFVRDPFAGMSLGELVSVRPEDVQHIEYFETEKTGDAARELFNFVRTRAGMRKALETLKC